MECLHSKHWRCNFVFRFYKKLNELRASGFFVVSRNVTGNAIGNSGSGRERPGNYRGTPDAGNNYVRSGTIGNKTGNDWSGERDRVTVHVAGNKHADFFPVTIFFSLSFQLGELQMKTTK